MQLTERLRAALDETERVALAVTAEGWYEDVAKSEGWNEYHEAVREHILAHDPERELRMVAAHRKILDLHAPYEYRMVGGTSVMQCEHCAELCHSRSGLACDDPVDAVYPCETVQIVAEAYGVEV